MTIGTKLATKLEVFTMEQLEEIHDATMEVFENTGIEYHDEDALAIFKKHGAKVEGRRVYIPRNMVKDCLRTAPKKYFHRAMDEKRSLWVGDPDTYIYGPHFGAAFIKDADGTRRPSVLKDSVRALKLAQSSEVINFTAMHWCEPQDVNNDIRHLVIAKETLTHTNKPLFSYNIIVTKERASKFLDLLELGFGKLDNSNYCIGLSIASSSPLRYESSAVQPLIEFAKRHQPLYIANAPIMGVSAPIHPLGCSVVLNAECLATVVLSQLVQPGIPVVYGVNGLAASLRTCNSAWGSPEALLINMVNMQLAMDFYGLPTRIHGGDSTAEEVDYQAALETMQNVMGSALSGINIIYYCTGVLEDVSTISLEKFVLDEEIISRVDRIRRGVEFSKEALSVDLIHELGPGGLYLTHESTLKHCKKRWLPTLSDWDFAEGSERNILVRAHKAVERRIAEQPESMIDSALENELQRFVDMNTKV